MAIESLAAHLAARPKGDLLRLFLQHMTRKKSDFSDMEIGPDHDRAYASMFRSYASSLDRHWEGFVRVMGENGERPGESDKGKLQADMERLIVQLESSRIITNG